MRSERRKLYLFDFTTIVELIRDNSDFYQTWQCKIQILVAEYFIVSVERHSEGMVIRYLLGLLYPEFPDLFIVVTAMNLMSTYLITPNVKAGFHTSTPMYLKGDAYL